MTHHVHQCGHTGVAATVAKTRRRFCILKVHDLAKTVKFQCAFCLEMQAKAKSQVMAELPKSRLAPCTTPFYCTSCDYFDPYLVTVGHNKTTKYYGVIFTCLNTRAAHLELAVDCSTMEFIQVLWRFFSVRATSHVPQGPYNETNNPCQRVEFVQKIVDAFRKRWTWDVFPSLIRWKNGTHKKKKRASRRLCVSPDSECNSWKLEHWSNRQHLCRTRW